MAFRFYLPKGNDKEMFVSAAPTKTTNSKVPPGHLIIEWLDGEVKEQEPLPEGAIQFTFEGTKDLVYLQMGAGMGKLLKISDIIDMKEKKDTNWKKVTKIYNHEDFIAGATKLEPKKTCMSFVPQNDKMKKRIAQCKQAVKDSAHVKIMWVVTNADGKLVPRGIGLVVVKQVLATIGSAKI